MSKSLNRFASSVVALSTAFTGFVGLTTTVLADTPEIGGASLNSSTVYKDANAVEFTFTVSDSGNDNEEVLVIYHGYCVSDTLTAKEGQNTVKFKNIPDGEYLEADSDCSIVVVNTDGEFSNTIQVPNFEVDTRSPKISAVVQVENPTDETTPTFSFFSDEEGDIEETGDCVINTNTVTDTVNATDVIIYNDTDSAPLQGGTYSNCKIFVVDEAGNKSNELSIASFEVVDFISFQVQPASRREATVVNTSSAQIAITVNVPGEITTTSSTNICEVKTLNATNPRLVNAGSNTITLHSLEAGIDYANLDGACVLTFTPIDFPMSSVDVDLGAVQWTLGSGPLTLGVIVDAASPSVSEATANKVEQANKSTVGFSFTSTEGGTWRIIDRPANAGTCVVALTGAVFADLDNSIVHPSSSAFTYVLETDIPLANATYGNGTNTCAIEITDATGNAPKIINMPEFVISDSKSPTLAVYEPVLNQANTGVVEFAFTSNEYVPAANVDLDLDGVCFNGVNASIITNGGDIVSDINVLQIDLSVLLDNEGEFKFCQVAIEDFANNKSSFLVIPTFNVGLAGPELTDAEFPGGVTDNPVVISFESDEAGTYSLSGPIGCSINDKTMDLPLQKGVNTITFDNLNDGAFNCTITPFSTDGVAGNQLDSVTYNFNIDTDANADVTFVSVDTTKLEVVFNSETTGYLTFEDDSYCSSTQMVVKEGINVVKLNKIPTGTAVSKCKLTVTNNDSSDTITVSPFTVSANNNVLAKLPEAAVYRFYNVTTGKHVMTMDYIEANIIFTSNPNWKYEGQVFSAYKYDKITSACLDGAMPVYRYVNSVALSFVYVTSMTEMDALALNPSWIKEGVVFCAKDKDVTEAGTVKAIRFWNGKDINHVYTIDATESAQIKANPQWVLEGTAFVVKPKLAQ